MQLMYCICGEARRRMNFGRQLRNLQQLYLTPDNATFDATLSVVTKTTTTRQEVVCYWQVKHRWCKNSHITYDVLTIFCSPRARPEPH